MTTASFTIPMRPKAKSRPRFKGRRAFTDPAQRKWEAELKERARTLFKSKPWENKVGLWIEFYFSSKKRQKGCGGVCECETYRAKKPDLDNLVKSVKDALNGVLYLDDRQVVSLTSSKYDSCSERIIINAREYEE